MSQTYKGLWDFYLSYFALSIYSYTYIQSYFLIICCEICKTPSYSCIEVNDKRRVCLPTVMAQNAKYFGLYRNSQLCCDVTPTSRMFYSPNKTWQMESPLWTKFNFFFNQNFFLVTLQLHLLPNTCTKIIDIQCPSWSFYQNIWCPKHKLVKPRPVHNFCILHWLQPLKTAV